MKVDKIDVMKDNSPALLFHGIVSIIFTIIILFCCLHNKTVMTPAFFADDGGGMDPERIRKCMSLGFSSKKSNNTIGQCNDFDLLPSSLFLRFFKITSS